MDVGRVGNGGHRILGVQESVVLLHGFGATHRAWDGVRRLLPAQRYLALAPDLPGHGDSAAQRPLTFEGCVAAVLAIAPRRFVLCGYSLGGRIALHVALAQPHRVSRMVLVSATAGIEGERARAERIASDQLLARELLTEPYESFIERWRGQPLFAADPPEVAALAREDQLRNDPTSLAAVLRSIGTGSMAPLWERLGELSMPVTVLAGSRDSKFQELGRRMATLLPHGRMRVVPGGHALALENPAAVAGALGQPQGPSQKGRAGLLG
jgi:2-succinyl-6-hydroxy-2,4-cyclohexadiene-1-carboxylate synthase